MHGTLRSGLKRYPETLLRLARDESADALVEYCIVMATLTVLMMLAYRNVGNVANTKANSEVTNLTNSSLVAP